jgi:hypothetical protein
MNGENSILSIAARWIRFHFGLLEYTHCIWLSLNIGRYLVFLQTAYLSRQIHLEIKRKRVHL